jgi:hypothetical protein
MGVQSSSKHLAVLAIDDVKDGGRRPFIRRMVAT